MALPTEVLLAIIGGAAAVLGLVGWRLGRGGGGIGSACFIALLLSGCVLIPEHARDIGLVSMFVVLGLVAGDGLFDRVAAAAVFGVFAWFVAWLVPGGWSVAILGCIVIFGAVHCSLAVQHLRRLHRAGALEPGTPVDREVEVAGTTVPAHPHPLDENLRCAGWQLTWPSESEDGVERQSSGLLHLASPRGLVFVDLSSAKLDVEPSEITDEGRQRLCSLLSLPDHEGQDHANDDGRFCYPN